MSLVIPVIWLVALAPAAAEMLISTGPSECFEFFQDHVSWENCCNFRFLIRHVWGVLHSERDLEPGTARCRPGSFRQCCTVNENLDQRSLPWYASAIQLVRVYDNLHGRSHYLKLVQGTSMNYLQGIYGWKFRLPHFTGLGGQGASTGGGLLWPCGFTLSRVVAQLRFKDDASVNFLEIAAGTGLASLVALLRGWEVLSTDRLAASSGQRLFSVKATFGNTTAFRRFRVDTLDLFDTEKWPRETFKVISSAVTNGRFEEGQESKFQHYFRRLAAERLAPDGVAVYVFHFPEESPHVEKAISELLEQQDGLEARLYQEDLEWMRIEVHQLKPRLMHLAAFCKAPCEAVLFGRELDMKI